MTDIDDRLRRDLPALADRMPATDIVEASVRHGQQLRLRRTTIAATTGIAIVVAAVIVPLTLAGRSAHKTGSQGPTPAPAKSAGLGKLLNSNQINANKEFEVGQPYVGSAPDMTPVPPVRQPCRPKRLRATARTGTTVDGVVGVITLAGSTLTGSQCALGMQVAPVALLDHLGHRLAVPIAADTDTTNPVAQVFDEGNRSPGVWGFAWRGSWCGRPAAAVEFALGNASPVNPHNGRVTGPPRHLGNIDVPLTGPGPACTGRSTSVLVPGASNQLGQPVQTAPAEWTGLRASLAVSATTNGAMLTGLVLTLRNVTGQAITLSPCPVSNVSIQSRTTGLRGVKKSAAGIDIQGGIGDLTCPSAPRVVPANGSIAVTLADQSYDQNEVTKPHSTVTIDFGIAGVPTATAHSRVR